MMWWQDIPGWNTYSSTFLSLQAFTQHMGKLPMLGWKFHSLPSHPVGTGLWHQSPQASEKCKKAVSYCKGPKRITPFVGRQAGDYSCHVAEGIWEAFGELCLHIPAEHEWSRAKRSWGKDVHNALLCQVEFSKLSIEVMLQKNWADAAWEKKAFLWPGPARQLSVLGLALRVFLCTSLTVILTALSEISALSLMENLFVSMSGL